MKYKRIFLIAAFFIPTLVFSQNENDLVTPRRHQFGVNATGIIKELFTFSNTPVSQTSPYIFTYKYFMGNTALRVGIGGNNRLSKSNPNTGAPLSSTRVAALNIRAGFEWHKNLSKHWEFYYGGDLIYNYSLNRTISSTIPVGFPPQSKEVYNNTESFGVGGGPMLGFEFRLSKRVSFNVETQGYFVYSENRNQEKNFFFTGSKTNTFSSVSDFRIILPTALFFAVSL